MKSTRQGSLKTKRGGTEAHDLSIKQIMDYISMRVSKLARKLHIKSTENSFKFKTVDCLDFVAKLDIKFDAIENRID